MQTTPLTEMQRQALIAAAGDGFRVQLFESLADRMKVAGLLWNSAKVRPDMPGSVSGA